MTMTDDDDMTGRNGVPEAGGDPLGHWTQRNSERCHPPATLPS
jgi:hypothetical protein